MVQEQMTFLSSETPGLRHWDSKKKKPLQTLRNVIQELLSVLPLVVSQVPRKRLGGIDMKPT